MIYLKAPADGRNVDGIGAVLQCQLLIFAISKRLGFDFLFDGFSRLTHYQHCNLSQEEFMKDVNDFFGGKITIENQDSINKLQLNQITEEKLSELCLRNPEKDLIVEFSAGHIMKFFCRNNKEILHEDKKSIEILRQRLSIRKNLEYSDFTRDVKNIAIHIRNYNSIDICHAEVRDYFNVSKKDYHTNLIESISSLYEGQNSHIRVYSQGTSKDFEFLTAAKISNNHTVSLHIEEHPVSSLFYMINSDVLIMANSSFSWISHLIGSHELVCMKYNFNHPMYRKNLRIIDKNGIIQ